MITVLQVHLGAVFAVISMTLFLGGVVAFFFLAMHQLNIIYAGWCILCISTCVMLHAFITRQSSKVFVRNEEDVRVVTERIKRLTSLVLAPIVAAPKALVLEVPEEGESHWKPMVQTLLDVVDIVVIDVSVLTPGIEWEVTQLLKLDRPNVVCIADEKSPSADRRQLNDLFAKEGLQNAPSIQLATYRTKGWWARRRSRKGFERAITNVLGSANVARPKARGRIRFTVRSLVRLTVVYLISATVASVGSELILHSINQAQESNVPSGSSVGRRSKATGHGPTPRKVGSPRLRKRESGSRRSRPSVVRVRGLPNPATLAPAEAPHCGLVWVSRRSRFWR